MLIEYVGREIRKRRKILELPQATLAEMAGISVNTLYKIERGQTNATLDILEKVLDVLGLEVNLSIRKIN
jgi:transcriptional regulator with XRE-family HTH domain